MSEEHLSCHTIVSTRVAGRDETFVAPEDVDHGPLNRRAMFGGKHAIQVLWRASTGQHQRAAPPSRYRRVERCGDSVSDDDAEFAYCGKHANQRGHLGLLCVTAKLKAHRRQQLIGESRLAARAE